MNLEEVGARMQRIGQRLTELGYTVRVARMKYDARAERCYFYFCWTEMTRAPWLDYDNWNGKRIERKTNSVGGKRLDNIEAKVMQLQPRGQ